MKQTASKTDFAARLNQLCSEHGLPEKFDGRQVQLAQIFKVSQKGARKWLEGEGMPTLERSIEIARHFGVHTEWLLSGRGEKYLDGRRDQVLDHLPADLKQETFDFLEFKIQKQFTGEQLARYLRWLDHMKNHPPGGKKQ